MRQRIFIVLGLFLAGCQQNGFEAWDAYLKAEHDREIASRRAEQERFDADIDARMAAERAERVTTQEKVEVERTSALRTRISTAQSFEDFRAVYDDCKLTDADIKLEVEAALRAWYLKRYYMPAAIQSAVESQNLVIGMTADQSLASWGFPQQVNRTGGVWGIHEQWVYGGSYLYFENGILTSWQD